MAENVGESAANEEAPPPNDEQQQQGNSAEEREENNNNNNSVAAAGGAIDNNNNDDDDDSDDGDDSDSDDEDEESPLAHLPDYVIRRVDRLRDLDNRRSALMQGYLGERAALERKYARLVEPLFEERTRIIHGQRDDEIDRANTTTTTTQMNGEKSESSPGDESKESNSQQQQQQQQPSGEEEAVVVAQQQQQQEGNAGADAPAARVKGIPQFWVCSMTHNETTGELITEDDVDCLESLTNITCNDREDGKGFTLTFHFAPNEYFSNSVLTKSYDVPNLLLSDEPLLKGVTGTKVEWKSDERALTYRMVKKKQRGKGKYAGQVRTVTKKEELESFFKWFEPPDMPSMDDIDEEEAERLEELFDDDYEVAEAFRSHVIPRAVLWFTGQAEESEITNALLEDDDDSDDNDDNNENNEMDCNE